MQSTPGSLGKPRAGRMAWRGAERGLRRGPPVAGRAARWLYCTVSKTPH